VILRKPTIIFDFDGTLFDSYEGIMLAFKEASRELFKIEYVLKKGDIGPKLRNLYSKAFDDCFLESYNEFENLFRQYYDTEYYIFGKLFDGVAETLNYFHQNEYELYVISNKPQNILLKTISELDLTKLFKLIVGSSTIPSKDVNKLEKLKIIIELNNIDINNCFVLGDTIEDLDMANSNGCVFIHAKYGYGQIIEPCISISSFLDLKQIII